MSQKKKNYIFSRQKKKLEERPMGNASVDVTPFNMYLQNLIVSTFNLKIAEMVTHPRIFYRERRKLLHFIKEYLYSMFLYYKL